jgi:hypothetical protein
MDVRERLKANEQLLAQLGYPACLRPCRSLVIDVNPRSAAPVLLLHELLHVWGFSSHDWTPFLFLLRELLSEQGEVQTDPTDFRIDEAVPRPPVYSFLYVRGTVRAGRLEGAWLPPRASPTNSALLWPEPLQFFVGCIHRMTPNYLFPGPLPVDPECSSGSPPPASGRS